MLQRFLTVDGGQHMQKQCITFAEIIKMKEMKVKIISENGISKW